MTGLALPLGAEPWSLGAAQVGLFGSLGLAGALGRAARSGGRADGGHTQRTSGWSLALLAASWLLIVRSEPLLWFLIVGIVLLDFAVQAAHVNSQHLLTTAHPDHAGNVIGADMAFCSLGSRARRGHDDLGLRLDIACGLRGSDPGQSWSAEL